MSGIGISAEVYDLYGALYIYDRQLDRGVGAKNKQRDRRVSRTATLDGGVAIYDTGFAVGDRTINVRVPKATTEIVTFLEYMIETYATIQVMSKEGAFKAVPNRFTMGDDGSANMELMITEDLGEDS